MLGQSKKYCIKLFGALRWRVKKYLPKVSSRQSRWLTKQLQQRRFKTVLDAYEVGGITSSLERIESLESKQNRIKAYHVIARKELSRDVLSAGSLARKAYELDDSESNRRKTCMMLWDAGSISAAYTLLQSLPASVLTLTERERALQIRGAYELFVNMPLISNESRRKDYVPDASCVMYIASSSHPYHTTGYTTRTHHLLEALTEAGWSMHCVTRPGYPADRPDSRHMNASELTFIDGIPYERVSGKHRREIQYDQYIMEAAKALEKVAYRLRPSLIHAASNYEAGLPALIVARRLGIPFCYEVRGLWEYTAASKKPGWEQTERFALDRMLESYTAANADQVFTLTKALSAELVRRGVRGERIKLLPNAVNLELFKPIDPDRELQKALDLKPDAFVCGYVGSVVKYEGLDDLVSAMPELLRHVPDSRLIVVGGGDELGNLKALAKRLGVARFVTFTGKVPHAEVDRYFSLFSAAALPRKPYTVCKLVSPLKPFEAMAMKVPLIVSNVDSLAEIFIDGKTALVHESGNINSLANALIRMAKSPDLRIEIALNAFQQVREESQWWQIVRPVSEYYSSNGVREKKYV